MPRYIRVDETTGEILSCYSTSVKECKPSYPAILVADKEQSRLLVKFSDYLYLNGQVVKKPTLTINTDRTTLQADGQDVVHVTVSGVPEDKPSVRLIVGTQEVDLPRGETLELTADTPGFIVLALKETVFLHKSKSLEAL